MESNKLNFVTGFLVIAFVSFILLFLSSNNYLKSNRCNSMTFAEFGNVSGLSVGSPAKINGVDVGFVTSIELHQNSQKVLVGICFTKAIKIPEDTVAAISFESFISGNKFIDLQLGQADDALEVNQKIYLTRSSLNLEGLLSSLLGR